VVDIVPDYLTARTPGRPDVPLPVIQIWVDPHYPEAHREPRLRKWLEAMSREGWAALVRFDPQEAMMLIPPIMSDQGRWEELGGASMTVDPATHKAEDIAAKLNAAGIMP
jgi:hypothetical protein